MKTINFRYSISYKATNSEQKIIVLTQRPYFRGVETIIEIPLEDIDSMLDSLKKAKDELTKIEISEIRRVNKIILDPLTINTLVALFLSGVSTAVLSKQYEINEDVIKENLEEKGIILMEEI